MSALRSVAAMMAVACTLLLAPAAGQARKPPSLGQARKPPSLLVSKINEVREAHGVRPARHSRSLSKSSSAFARYLARTHQFGHSSRIRASNRFSKLGELLALTPRRVRKRRMLNLWLQSPSHRAVLLDPAFRYVGVGRGRYGGARAVVWTVHFGR